MTGSCVLCKTLIIGGPGQAPPGATVAEVAAAVAENELMRLFDASRAHLAAYHAADVAPLSVFAHHAILLCAAMFVEVSEVAAPAFVVGREKFREGLLEMIRSLTVKGVSHGEGNGDNAGAGLIV